MEALTPVLTRVGLAALMNAGNTGVEAEITHILLGGHNQGEAMSGYTPLATSSALRRQRAAISIADGERVADAEIQVEAIYDGDEEFWVTELAFVVDGQTDANGNYVNGSGTVLAIWSDPTYPLIHKSESVPLILAYNLALEGAPANVVNVHVTGPSIGLLTTKKDLVSTTSFVRTWRRMIQSDNLQFIPQIQAAWR